MIMMCFTKNNKVIYTKEESKAVLLKTVSRLRAVRFKIAMAFLMIALFSVTDLCVSVYASGEDPPDLERAIWAKNVDANYYFWSEETNPNYIYKEYLGSSIVIQFDLMLREWDDNEWIDWSWQTHGYEDCYYRDPMATWSSTGGCSKIAGSDLWARYQFNAPGHYTVTGRHRGFDCNNPDITGGDVTVDVFICSAELAYIKFTSDYIGFIDNNTDWTDSGSYFQYPEWYPDYSRNNPIMHNKSQPLSVEVYLKVQPSDLDYHLIGEGVSNSYFNFESDNLIESTGEYQAIPLTADMSLPGFVSIITDSIDWEARLNVNPPLNLDLLRSGPHKVYVTYGPPSGSAQTEKRINWACTQASGGITEENIADAIHDALADNDPPYELYEKESNGSGWTLMAETTWGDCDDQATLMRLALNLLGVSATTAQVAASTNAGAGACLDLEYKYDGGYRWWLILDFNPTAGYSWNAYEGCCVAAGNYYAVTPKRKASNDYDMLKNEIPGQQYWVRTIGDKTPGSTDWDVLVTGTEEPKP